VNFNHLNDDDHVECLKILRKINFFLEMLERISGQAYHIAPVKPKPTRKTDGE